MLKKMFIGTAVVLGLVAVVWGTKPFRYAKTWVKSVKQKAEDNIPVDLKIQHAREEAGALVDSIKKCMTVIATQQVDVEHSERKLAQARIDLDAQKQAILALRQDVDSGDSSFVYSGRAYTLDEIRDDLTVRFERYQTAKTTLDRDEQILTARRKALRANERRLDQMIAAKKDLEVKIEQLEARWKTLQAAETASELEIDDSQLARTKKLISEINKQLDVRQRMLDAEGKFVGLIPVETKKKEVPVVDVTRKIDAYFGGKPAPKKLAGKPSEL